MTDKQQMELGLRNTANYRRLLRRQRRLPGAHWWFAQMRLAVNNAVEWGAPPPVRPEQIDLLHALPALKSDRSYALETAE
jgi:hypothetical protein